MHKKIINMFSQADSIKGQGVGSAFLEQLELVKNGLSDIFEITVNKTYKADIVHYHTLNIPYYLSIPLAKRYGTTVCYVHFLPETVKNSLNLPPAARKSFNGYMLSFYKHVDHLVTVNPYFIDRLEEYGVDRKKVTYIPNFVSETEFFPVSVDEKALLREKYGIDKTRFTVLGVGQLQTRKGIFDFFECAEKMPDVQFIWAGGFSFGIITEGYEKIKKVMENPPANLKFLGIVDRERMNEVYNISDLMFLPSFEELFPMTTLEAMNCGIPVLLRDIPIYNNILFDYYEKELSVDGFIKTIEKLINDKDYYGRARANSWKGHLFYNREHVLQMWEEFYLSILK